MKYYKSPTYDPTEWQQSSQRAQAALQRIGAVLPPDFYCTGEPQLFLSDAQQTGDDPFDMTSFAGRIRIGAGSGFNSGHLSPFPHGPVRLALTRWGPQPDDCGTIIIGERSELNGTAIISACRVEIGNDVLFGPEVVIMDTDGHVVDRSREDDVRAHGRAPVIIGDRAWIGFGALIMKGVTIGSHAVVAARAVVTKDVPPHGVVAGNPARLIKQFEAAGE